MIDLHGIVYAYHSYAALNELVVHRTSASLPFCSRYRLIDFALSSMTNAGICDVGVVMQKNYQSLIDHLEGGKDWDLSRNVGGLTLMPPYGMHDSDKGEYRGCMEALGAVRSYIHAIKQNNVVLYRGDLAISLDLKEILEQHITSGAEITAVCDDGKIDNDSIHFLPDRDDPAFSKKMHLRRSNQNAGYRSTEVYIIRRDLLLEFIDWSQANGRLHFHRDALARYIRKGGKIGLYIHKGYVSRISSVAEYFNANLDMLSRDNRMDLFPEDRPVYTKGRSSISTYYSKNAVVKNSLIADGCYIDGELENCVLFRGVRINKGAKLKNCILFQDTIVGEDVNLNCVISDKNVVFGNGVMLTGNELLPVTIPKDMVL